MLVAKMPRKSRLPRRGRRNAASACRRGRIAPERTTSSMTSRRRSCRRWRPAASGSCVATRPIRCRRPSRRRRRGSAIRRRRCRRARRQSAIALADHGQAAEQGDGSAERLQGGDALVEQHPGADRGQRRIERDDQGGAAGGDVLQAVQEEQVVEEDAAGAEASTWRDIPSRSAERPALCQSTRAKRPATGEDEAPDRRLQRIDLLHHTRAGDPGAAPEHHGERELYVD